MLHDLTPQNLRASNDLEMLCVAEMARIASDLHEVCVQAEGKLARLLPCLDQQDSGRHFDASDRSVS
jgi:hypothetical protein